MGKYRILDENLWGLKHSMRKYTLIYGISSRVSPHIYLSACVSIEFQNIHVLKGLSYGEKKAQTDMY